ncbi:hypothetical protein BwSF12_47200 [Bradyrhizobium ottawaense]|uniref:hypothetical protein n=1 Tax=Bradyrhizobium ottawaense TaxID=931866 RepID=UPI0027D71C17|nr:hypothetical protein BwSH14_43720 [Bradyrhizobium ottawaense]GMO43324.1 hypothetical protein BwSF12_47200 [Bradyrhizobium ottawaense]GMO77730.1 hypothetical protein BwSF19_25020 [Bradyrhizobium ottawaense]GMO87632.1 hypothetical protein BwSH17_72290 [Bradyrhizobium ottawaense]
MKKANGYKTAAHVKGRRMGAVERALRLADHDATIPPPTDDFFASVFKAIKAFSGAKLRGSCADGGPTADLILELLSDRPLSRGDRRSLANLLAGELNSSGRPRAKAAELRAYVELLDEAKRNFPGKAAAERAAKWAARDLRALNRSPSTIMRDMERKRSYWAI